MLIIEERGTDYYPKTRTRTKVCSVEFDAHTYDRLHRDYETGQFYVFLEFSAYIPNADGSYGELYATGDIHYTLEPGKGLTAEAFLADNWGEDAFERSVEGVEDVVCAYAHITPERFRELTRRMCDGVAAKSLPGVRSYLARLALEGKL